MPNLRCRLFLKRSPRESQWAWIPEDAGDQGLMFGFACDETDELMPLPIMAVPQARRKTLANAPQGYSSIFSGPMANLSNVEYHGDRPVRVDTVVYLNAHSESVSNADCRGRSRKRSSQSGSHLLMDKNTKFHIIRRALVAPAWRSGVRGPRIDVEFRILVHQGGGNHSADDLP